MLESPKRFSACSSKILRNYSFVSTYTFIGKVLAKPLSSKWALYKGVAFKMLTSKSCILF